MDDWNKRQHRESGLIDLIPGGRDPALADQELAAFVKQHFGSGECNNECNVGRGAGYVASAVIRSGHELSFFDTLFTPTAAVAERVIEGRYDFLMISTMTMLFPEAAELARA